MEDDEDDYGDATDEQWLELVDEQFEANAESIRDEMWPEPSRCGFMKYLPCCNGRAGQLGTRSAAADKRLAALLADAAANKQEVAGLMLPEHGLWGPACNEALRTALGAGLRPASLQLSSALQREEDVVALAELVTAECGLETLTVSYCSVGLSGLRAIIEAARRCPTLRTVGLFAAGPRTDRWESLGCFTRGPQSEDCVLLLELLDVLKGRHEACEPLSCVHNEAFMDDVHGGGALLGLLGLDPDPTLGLDPAREGSG